MESPTPDPAQPSRLAVARALLTVKRGPEPAWPALAAAAFFAVCALGFAFGAIMAPSATLTHVEEQGQARSALPPPDPAP